MQIETLNEISIFELKTLLKKIPISRIKLIKETLDDLYYNTKDCTVSDEKYDIIKEYIQNEDLTYTKIGAPLRSEDNKIELPFWLGSLDKIKDETGLNKWLNSNKSHSNFIISEKLDGVSALLIIDNGIYNLYTRGNGSVGSDISYLVNYIKNIPEKITKKISVRGELIISKENFVRYSNNYSNARNMVSGIVNAKTLRKGARYLEFISYEILDDGILKKPDFQLKKLSELGFTVVEHEIITNINTDLLLNKLSLYKTKSKYIIDGIVVQSNIDYVRNNNDNPEYSFAFKYNMPEDTLDAEVIGIDWNISKRCMLKPTIKIRTVLLNGVMISSVTGFNAKFIVDNKICKGSIITIVRSGDVIPHIVKVVKSGEEGELPNNIDYIWNNTKVDIIIANKDNKNVHIKIIHHFLVTLGIKQIAINTIEKLYNIGITSILKLIKAEKKDFLKADGIQEKSAERIYTNIHNNLKEIPLYILMTASGVFDIGLGVKKLKTLTTSIPDIIDTFNNISRKEFYSKLLQVEGFSEVTANRIIINLPLFSKFLEDVKGYITIENKEKKDIEKVLLGKKYVFSGFRDKDLENFIEERGGSVVNTVSSKTSGVIVKTKGQETSKIEKAKRLGLDIVNIDEFKKMII